MKKMIVDNIYDKEITFNNLYDTWNIVRKTCKNRKALLKFALNRNSNLYNIYLSLKNKTYEPLPYRLFLIFEPKARLVMSQSVSDKIVNHFVANHYLLPYLEKYLIDSNVATRKNKGSKYASDLLEKYINKIRFIEGRKEIFCLNIDISKYFYSIDHQILINQVEEKIKDKDVINLIKKIVSETNKNYINKLIDIFNGKYCKGIPYYKRNVGLSIGAMTSQFLAIFYLNSLDHFIKEDLRCKYYIRYMDDLIVLSTDKEYLKNVWNSVKEKIELLNLKMNSKSNITRLSIGISFLGYKYRIVNDKLKISYRKKTFKKIRKKLDKLRDEGVKYYRTYSSYYGYLIKVKYFERNFKMKAVDKYEYYKNKRPSHIIFIKEGSFYKTFADDAVIIWDLFGYKWNNNSIAFGVSPYSKVLSKLNHLGISYGVIGDDEIYIDNDEEVYDSYKRIALTNYGRFKKKESLHSLIDELMEINIGYYDDIHSFLMQLKGEVVDEA